MNGRVRVLWLPAVLTLFTSVGECGASAWTRPAHQLWFKVGATFGFADEKFANDQLDETKLFDDGSRVEAGDSIPFDFVTGGEYRYQSYLLETAYGVTDWLEISGSLPFLHTVFENDNDEVEPGTGVGDVRLGVALGLWQNDRWVVSMAGGWKSPTADVPRSVYAQPLGEGQHDFTAWIRGGRSLWPHGWLQTEIGHRWRTENEELGFDPGREWHLRAEWGWQIDSTWAVVQRLVGLEGEPWTSREFGFEQEIGRRRLWSYAPSVIVGLGWRDLSLEVGGSFALAGEDLPVQRELRVGLMTEWGGR